VEGGWLRNAFRWRQSIGPWEERPGHFGDCWQYWTDDGLGYYEFLQVQDYTVSTSLFFSRHHLTLLHLKSIQKLSEDIGAAPIWVFNNGNTF